MPTNPNILDLPRAARTAALALVLGGAACASPALADGDDLSTKWPINDDDPMAYIPSVEERNQNPLEFAYYLQDLVFRAETAYRRGDWQGAVKYYRPISVAVPNRATGHSRLCDAYARLGKTDLAIESCRRAVGLKGAKVIDHARLLDLYLRKPSFDELDAEEVEASLAHLREHARLHPQALPGEAPETGSQEETSGAAEAAQPAPDETAPRDPKGHIKAQIRAYLEEQRGEPEAEVATTGMHLPTEIEFSSCRLAVRTGDLPRLAECLPRLRTYEAPEALLLPFEWTQALGQRDEATSNALLAKARQLGVGEQGLAAMQAEHDEAFGKAKTDEAKGALLRHLDPRLWTALGVLALVILSFGLRRFAGRSDKGATPPQASHPQA